MFTIYIYSPHCEVLRLLISLSLSLSHYLSLMASLLLSEEVIPGALRWPAIFI